MKNYSFSGKTAKRLGAIAMAITLSTVLFYSDSYLIYAEESQSEPTENESSQPSDTSSSNTSVSTSQESASSPTLNQTNITDISTSTNLNTPNSLTPQEDSTPPSDDTNSALNGLGVGIEGIEVVIPPKNPDDSDNKQDLTPIQDPDNDSVTYIPLENHSDVTCVIREVTEAPKSYNCQYKYQLEFTIGETAQGDQELDISTLALECLNKFKPPVMPGATYSYEIMVKTVDGLLHTYQYKDGSLVVSPPNLEDHYVYDADGKPVNVTDLTTSDGQKLPIEFIPAMSKSTPIQRLLGVNSSNKVNLGRLKELYNILADSDNFAGQSFTGKSALTDYIVWYYNHYTSNDIPRSTPKNYDSIASMMKDDPKLIYSLQGGSANAQYMVTETQLRELESHPQFKDYLYIAKYNESSGIYMLQIKWPENDLASSAFEQLYHDLFIVSYGNSDGYNLNYETFSRYINSTAGIDPGAAEYADVTSNLYKKANEYFKTLLALGFDAEDEDSVLQMYIGLNGPYINNAYQINKMSYVNTITLEQVDGDLTINKVDANGNRITGSAANFQLYYITLGEDESEIKWYYTKDPEGNVTFTTDINEAYVLVTVDGTVGVQYLLPNRYYIQELLAPNGYTLNPEAISVLVQSGMITVVNLPNTLIPPPTPPTPPEGEDTGGGGGGGGGTPAVAAAPAVLGAVRAIPEEPVPLTDVPAPGVLGERRDVQTADKDLSIYLMVMALCIGTLTILMYLKKKSS